MYASISSKLHHLLEHNPEFCTHTINVWQFEGMISIQFFHAAQRAKYFEMFFMIVFLQDFFTVGLGWALFGGLPFDLVSFLLIHH
jgi:hypothetical protein